MLMSELLAEKSFRGSSTTTPDPHHRPVIELCADKTNRFLGTNLSGRAMARYLTALEMEVETEDENTLRVKPPLFGWISPGTGTLWKRWPGWKGIRTSRSPSPPSRPPRTSIRSEIALGDRVREIMVGMGFCGSDFLQLYLSGICRTAPGSGDKPFAIFRGAAQPL
jgi:hypothetical protein